MDAARRAGLAALTFATQTAGRRRERAEAASMLAGAGVASASRPGGATAMRCRSRCCRWRWLYGAPGARTARSYRARLARPRSGSVPVLVVGNLVVGGAGKTPTVIALVRLLRGRGYTPGIVSRGYGRQQRRRSTRCSPTRSAARVGDEPLLLRLRTGVPVSSARDRVAAGARAAAQRIPRSTSIVSDDGLQHLALARDVQVLVFDERGVGNGRLLPAGPLREPMPAAVPPRSARALQRRARRARAGAAASRTRRLAGVVDAERLVARRRRRRCDALAGAARPRACVAAAGIAAAASASSRCCEAAGPGRSSRCRCPTITTTTTLPWPAPTRRRRRDREGRRQAATRRASARRGSGSRR